MSETSQRAAWIDILKCIAILCIIIAHHPMGGGKTFNIVAFAIPLFFFISGYLFNPDVTSHNLLQRRFNSILKPYLFTVICICLIYIIFKDKPFFLWYLFWTVYGNGPNLPKLSLHLWFLPNLFLVTLFTWLLLRYIKNLRQSIILQLLVIAIFLILGFLGIHLFWNLKVPISVTNFFITNGNQFFINGLLDNPVYSKEPLLNCKQFILNGLPWSLDIVLISTAFFISGYFVKKHHLDKLFHKGPIAFTMLLLFALLHYFYYCTIDLNTRRFDNLFICILLAYASIYFCTYAAHKIAEKINRFTDAMQYIGQHSLIIYIFHPIMQGKVYFSISALFPNASYIAILPAFIAGIGLPLLLNYLLLERFKFFRYWYYAR
jgi:fucose 4-O-acetylase-like acetyltransferase